MSNGLELNKVQLGEPLPDWHLESIFGDAIPAKEDFLGKPLTYIVDCFTDKDFKGNPAGVCVLKQKITDENLSR